MIFLRINLPTFAQACRYDSSWEGSDGVISTRPGKCWCGLPSHTGPVRALLTCHTVHALSVSVLMMLLLASTTARHPCSCYPDCDLVECENGKGSPYSATGRRVLKPIPVLGSQPAGDVSHKPSSRLPLLSARPAVTLAILKRTATNFAVW